MILTEIKVKFWPFLKTAIIIAFLIFLLLMPIYILDNRSIFAGIIKIISLLVIVLSIFVTLFVPESIVLNKKDVNPFYYSWSKVNDNILSVLIMFVFLIVLFSSFLYFNFILDAIISISVDFILRLEPNINNIVNLIKLFIISIITDILYIFLCCFKVIYHNRLEY